jgi:1-hydroxycarotenoid 3,4-desaturase
MLIAHVEQCGVWLVEGGMRRIATAMEGVARGCGAQFRFGAEVREIVVRDGRACGVVLADGERIGADAVILNVDAGALNAGFLGREAARVTPAVRASERSLSAVTWSMVARTSGFPLVRHNVFFSDDYTEEFRDLVDRRRLPAAPTVYVCAQDRADADGPAPAGAERLLCLVNAPPVGDERSFTPAEIDACTSATLRTLRESCLQVERSPERTVVTTPSEFEALFPGTGGALYGPASHGWRASFRRPGSRTRLRGLYLAGGSVHPGAGVPMATLSGRLAAASLIEDLDSTRRSSRVAMPGGTSMRSATTAGTESR